MASGERARPGPGGFTYLGLLVAVALIGLALAAAGQVVATAAQREREAQLLWVGDEYRAAIGRYWGQRRAYPQRLEELLGGEAGAPLAARFLRRLYPDPMTRRVDWVLVPAPDGGGGIMGVASRSTGTPLKTGGFAPADRDQDFEKARTYGDWQFTFVPGAWRRRAP